MVLLPQQERVVIERTELVEKLDKLRNFLYSTPFESLHAAEQGRLVKQAEIMESYADILLERIQNFNSLQ